MFKPAVIFASLITAVIVFVGGASFGLAMSWEDRRAVVWQFDWLDGSDEEGTIVVTDKLRDFSAEGAFQISECSRGRGNNKKYGNILFYFDTVHCCYDWNVVGNVMALRKISSEVDSDRLDDRLRVINEALGIAIPDKHFPCKDVMTLRRTD